MKKKGIFSHDFYPIKGGQGTHIYNIYNELLNLFFYNFIIFSPLKNELKNHKTIFSETNNSKLKNIGMSIKLFFSFEKIIKENDLGIIHLHGGPGGLFLFKKLNIPVIFTSHHTYWQQYNYVKGQKWKIIFYFLEKLSYKLADKIICVSEDTKNILKEKYDIEENKLVYIPNGINLEEFKYDEKIDKEENSLVFVGRLDERKGIDFLVEAMNGILKENNKIKLYIVGEGKLKNKLENFIKINKLEKNIIFCGKLSGEELRKRIQKSEIMITPSVFEGFGISVLEGMALKVPVIGTNVDGIRTIIKNGKNGILVKYGNKEDLKDKIIELINNKDLQKKYIENAYNDLESKYNWNLITKKTIDEYEKLV